MRLSRALKIKRPLYAKIYVKVIYQHDNARPHVAKVVKETLEALQWDVLPHPPYSPDIVLSDYHMFRSMTHGLAEIHFTSYEEAKNWVDVWIASKDEEFFRHGIRLKIEYPGGKNHHFRHLLFFAFHRGQKAAEAARDIFQRVWKRCHREASSTKMVCQVQKRRLGP
ncbi:hypothetical protein LAZ67_2006479 [Cordylochernes scorpioides]|uniref:Mos1 transposase HTH domain-containing protein n=1 Tax=Cordylochernes scorpioides TaxID=51811 RepID=A0ABY6K5H0_9ARAC|nr:hypothetical protein LAZ67_2006479 [Cordylochernes scorpioides]